MRSAVHTSGLAVVLLVAAAIAPVMAQPVPTEGPAIDPSIYKVSANAKTIAVNCDDAKQTLAAALADKTGVDLNIVFSGTCKEYVSIQRDGVAIRGKDATAAVAGGIEVNAAKRVLLENVTCRDNARWESCIGVLYGASVTMHNIKVFNSAVRGVMILDAVALIEGLTVDKTVSTSILIRGSEARLEGELTFGHTVEGCLLIDGVSSVFSKSGVITARDCAAGVLVQSNSTFQAPFASFTLDHNTFAGLMLITQGTFSYGGPLVAKNNTQAGIFIDDGSSFAPFTNISGGSLLTLENNGTAGIYVRDGSFAEVANVAANTGSVYGVLVEDARLRLGRSKTTDNTKADVHLQFGAHATVLNGAVFGKFTCDGTELTRGLKTPCVKDTSAPPTAKPTSAVQPTSAQPSSAQPTAAKPAAAPPAAEPVKATPISSKPAKP
jgi:hypothetical protein